MGRAVEASQRQPLPAPTIARAHTACCAATRATTAGPTRAAYATKPPAKRSRPAVRSATLRKRHIRQRSDCAAVGARPASLRGTGIRPDLYGTAPHWWRYQPDCLRHQCRRPRRRSATRSSLARVEAHVRERQCNPSGPRRSDSQCRTWSHRQQSQPDCTWQPTGTAPERACTGKNLSDCLPSQRRGELPRTPDHRTTMVRLP